MRSWLVCLTALVLVLFSSWKWLLLPRIEQKLNKLGAGDYPEITGKAKELHRTLVVGDLHSDSFLWARNSSKEASYGHLDLPRAQRGNLGIQVFTSVTKSPRGQNYNHNSADAWDNITLLAIAQGWPPRTWSSLLQRALYHSERATALQKSSPELFRIVRTAEDLRQVLQAREQGANKLAAILGIEGAHPLEGDISNISRLYNAGFRVMGLQHFFDNELGGSLHGQSGGGLTEFGRAVVKEMDRRSIIIDVAHSSESVVKEVLAQSKRPLIVSHTGLKGSCDSPRNISDALMKKIAERGGLIGIGFWKGAVCDNSPRNIVKTIRYAIGLLGVNHVALGSDYDGSVEVSFDVSNLGVLTAEMLRQEFTEEQIRKVMGGNMREFFLKHLP